MDPNAAGAEAARAAKRARITRLVLIVVVVIGAFALAEVLRREAMPKTFVVRVEAEPDVVGDILYAEDLLSFFDVVVDFPGGERVRLDALDARASKSIRGASTWQPIVDRGLDSYLLARGVGDAPLRYDLGRVAIEDDEVVIRLDTAEDERIRRVAVRAAFDVVDLEGRAVADLTAPNVDDWRELEPGRYEAEFTLGRVLSEITYQQPLLVQTRGVEAVREVALEPSWFLGIGSRARRVEVDLDAAGIIKRPEVISVSPSELTQQAISGTELTIRGRSLGQILRVRLTGAGRSIPLRIKLQRTELLSVELPDELGLGEWEISYEMADVSGWQSLGARLSIIASFELSAPEPFEVIDYDGALMLRWTSGGAQGTLEASVEAGDGVRRPVFEGSVGDGAARFPLEGKIGEVLGPGSYTLLVVPPPSVGMDPIRRNFRVGDPPPIPIVLNFRRGGSRFTNFDEVQVNGLTVDRGNSLNTVTLKLPVGTHEVSLKINSRWKTYEFDVTGVEGEVIKVDVD